MQNIWQYLAGIVTAITGVAIFVVSRFDKAHERDVKLDENFEKLHREIKENHEETRRTLRDLLHDRIFERGNFFVEKQGFISWADRENFNRLVDDYKALDGNGTGDEMARLVNDLPSVRNESTAIEPVETKAMQVLTGKS